jgi:hypothetical protein
VAFRRTIDCGDRITARSVSRGSRRPTAKRVGRRPIKADVRQNYYN